MNRQDGALPGHWALLWIAMAWLVLLASFIAFLPPMPVDETRYLGVALEMRQSGDFLVPTINGHPYSHKPPLLFWLINTGWTLFGVNAWWPRLVTGLASLACLGMTFVIARQLWPPRPAAARLAPVLLMGSLLWAAWTPMIMFDLVLTFWALAAIACLVQAAKTGERKYWPAMGLALGLGVLAKGPVILLLVSPAVLLAPLWHPGQPAWRAWYGGLLLAILVAAGVALAWALPAAARGGPDYAQALFWKQSAGRVADSFAHQRAWWWYLPIIALMTMPWILWPRAWSALWRLRAEADWGVRLLLCWILPPVLIFSMISGKQPQYLLPLAPAAMLLLARSLEPESLREEDSRWRRLSGVALPLLLAGAVAWLWQDSPDGQPAWLGELPWWLVAGLLMVALLPLLSGRNLLGGIFGLASSTVLLVAVVMSGIMSVARPWYDLGPASRFIAGAQERGLIVVHVGDSHGRFRFLGRLKQTVDDLPEYLLSIWACRHPKGLVVQYPEKPDDAPAAVFRQPFRGEWLSITPGSELSTGCRRKGID